MKKAIVLLSGGLDSTVALYWALKKGFRCHALAFDYGQRHAKELRSARRVAALAKIPFEIMKFRLPWGGSTLTSRTKKLPHHTLSQISAHKIPSTYVPGRNTIFLSFAMSWADQMNADGIVIGANALDYSGYPDCRPRYLKAFERVASEGSRRGSESHKKISIWAPLVRLTKVEIVKLGWKLGAPLHFTWSCYQGGRTPCGQCDSCLLREKGFVGASRWLARNA